MRPLKEQLRYILRFGKLVQVNGEWMFTAAPDVDCEMREMKDKSRWHVIEVVYDLLKSKI